MNIVLPEDPAIPLLGIYPEDDPTCNKDTCQLLAIINKAAMNIVEHVSFVPVGTSSSYMPRRGIAGILW